MRVFLVFLTLLFSFSISTIANADNRKGFRIPAEFRGEGKVPSCNDDSVLNKITKRFRRNNIHHLDSDLAFERIGRVRETDFLKNPKDQNDRRFCAAHAHLNNGKHPTLYYLIQEHHGLASISWGVDFCVNGYDFARAHGSSCRSLREPF